MALQSDDDLLDRLRQLPDNAGIFDLVGSSSAHGDLGQVVFDYAKTTGGLRVTPVASADFPALVATPPDADVIVVAATGMHELLLRVGDGAPDGARLGHERVVHAGPGWWQVNPFDPEVSRADTEAELQRWFSAAGNWRPSGDG